MLLSASLLLLTAAAPQAAGDIVPSALATRPGVVQLGEEPYDWSLQQGRRPSSLRVADNTANCSTATIKTQRNSGSDEVHDCGFD
ncbi:hypothetical protein [Pinisolibacter aquiterrae]|uniref:hypothetical protein n=1 Tax=Pinisolibacter aquiterrae TaxID=2815579 RepID=UPI001C3DE811|nr:hypothetical protein [Pinisolibacter aquiterrae]MBV5264874.1 hypothetical protein [Pinisolibacter aquiterrae]MCC8234293.1 hypothetical protein [Pinisolibacter aquiterrae]